MVSSGGLFDTRSAPRKPAHAQFDLRISFAAERRLLPALLLIGLVAAFASMSAGANALALAWLALYGVNAAIRFLIATEYATAPGEVLARVYRGNAHRVTVLDDGFEYRGKSFTSLSRVAREITGTQWNGLVFFGLEQRGKGKGEHG